MRAATRPADLLARAIHLRITCCGDRLAVRRVELDRQQSDLRAVGAEDVGEARGDHRHEAVVLERPRRVLAARSAAEVPPGDKDRILREIPPGLLRPVVEQEFAEAGSLHALEEL